MRTRLTVLLVCIAVCANAQRDSVSTSRLFGLSFNIAPSVRVLTDIGAFNTALKSAGLPSINSAIQGADFGVGFLANRWYFQTTVRSYHATHTDKFNTINGVGTDIRVQYNLGRSNKVFYGPFVGFNGDTFQFNFDNPNQRSFQNALQSPGAVSHAKVDAYQIIGGTVGFGVYTMRNLSRGLHSSAGLEVGYTFTNAGSYRVNDELVQSPASTFSGVDIRLTIRFFVVRSVTTK